jgi:hypothetical protein
MLYKVYNYIRLLSLYYVMYVVMTGVSLQTNLQGKGKAIPVAGHEGPWGYETSRLPYFLNNWMCRPPFPPGRFLVLISVRG